MTTDELKVLITQLAKDDPAFFTDLVGDIIKQNLHIGEQERDFYAARDAHVNPQLSWGESSRMSDTFSYA